jgi:ADP-heptose:LPS heptosyltransferase
MRRPEPPQHLFTARAADRHRPALFVLRALKLGDLLVAVPALHGLRRSFPEHRLILGVPGWLAPIAALIGGVDALAPTPGLDAPVPAAPGSVDIAVNMHGNGPESRAMIGALAAKEVLCHRGPDGPRDPREPEWRDGLHERVRWVRLVRAFGIPADPGDVSIQVPTVRAPPTCVVHVGAFYGSRRWPVDRFATVARVLQREFGEVVITGGKDDRERARVIGAQAGLSDDAVLAGRTDLIELAALIAAARIVVSVDTGAAHLASAYGTPSVVIFGPAPASEWGPPPGPHRVLTDPRLRRGDVFAAEPDPALLAVGSEDVLAAVREVIR